MEDLLRYVKRSDEGDEGLSKDFKQVNHMISLTFQKDHSTASNVEKELKKETAREIYREFQ